MLIEIYVDKSFVPLMRHSYLNTESVGFSVDLSYVKRRFGNKIKKFYRIRFIDINPLDFNGRFAYYINERDFKKLRRR